MSERINIEFAATVLIEAAYLTDQQVCDKYGISTKTLQRYRKLLAVDSKLSSFVHTKKQAFDRTWAEELPIALRKALKFISDACEVADKTDPAVIEKMIGAVKIIADVQMTSRIIDARIANANRQANSLPGQGDSDSSSAFVS